MIKFKIITLCGSLRFIDTFVETQIFLERAGHVVLSVTKGDENNPPSAYEKSILDKVHFKKIMLSDCIYVINIDQYIGQSTNNEIEFASLTNKKIFYMTDTSVEELSDKSI